MFNKKMFKETFSQLKASENTLTEVMKMTKKRNRPYKVSRMALVAAIIILTLSMATIVMASIGFTQYESPAAMLQAFFGENRIGSNDNIIERDEHGKQVITFLGWERVPLDETLAYELIADYIIAQNAVISWGGIYSYSRSQFVRPPYRNRLAVLHP